jgi:hypothetical protein
MFDLFPAFTKITREGLNSIPRAVLSMIRPGPGISIFPTGDGGVCISADEVRRSGGGVGGGGGGGGIRLAKFVSLNTDGNTMQVLMQAGEGWAETQTTIYKPMKFQKQFYDDGETHYFSDGTEATFDTVDLNAAYQRRKNWSEGGDDYSEVQEITEAYEVGEWLHVVTDPFGDLVDNNNAGRHFGENGDLE